jgi:hypothetical protein
MSLINPISAQLTFFIANSVPMTEISGSTGVYPHENEGKGRNDVIPVKLVPEGSNRETGIQ